MPPEPPFPALVGKLLAQIHMTDLRVIDRRMAPIGLSRGTFGCLALLYDHDGRRQEDLRCHLGVNRSTVTRAVRRLIDLGYVRRAEDPDDRRAYRIWLEPAARTVRPQVFRILRENDRTMLRGISGTDRRKLHRLLGSVLENVTRNLATMHRNDPP